MATVTLKSINTGIHDTIANGVPDLDFTQDYDELEEGLANTPVMQVYWSSMELVSVNSQTDRRTFGGNDNPVRQKEYIFNVDLYLDPRGHVDQIFGTMMDLVDDINDVFEDQNQLPYFGVEGIKYYTYGCENIGVEYASTTYPVVRWTVTIGLF